MSSSSLFVAFLKARRHFNNGSASSGARMFGRIGAPITPWLGERCLVGKFLEPLTLTSAAGKLRKMTWADDVKSPPDSKSRLHIDGLI